MKRLIILVVLILAIGIVYFFTKGMQFYKSIYKPSAQKTEENKTSYNFLLLGYGGGVHEGTYLTDSMMVIHADLQKKKVLITSLPRDIWVKLPTKSGADFYAKLNSIYQLDLFPNTYPDVDLNYPKKKGYSNLISLIISQITGLRVDHYLAVDFTGFTKAIDAIGGVTVNVKKAFEDPEYPIAGKENDLCGKDEIFKVAEPFISPASDAATRAKLFAEKPEIEEFVKNVTDSPELAFPCRYEKLKFAAGPQFMNGETALKYVRSRHAINDGGDFGRAARQQEFLAAVKNKVLSFSMLTKIPALLDQLKNNISTDISPETITKLSKEVVHAKAYTVVNFVLSTDNYLIESRSNDSQYILIPKAGEGKWQEIITNFKNILDGITPTTAPIP